VPIFDDPSGRSAGARALRVRGLIVAAVMTVAATALYQLATGGYGGTFRLIVETNTIGEGLTPGAEVKLHGLAIGTVKSLESAGYNRQRMTVQLDPRQATALTADTQAQFTSSNVFGSAVVELVSGGIGEPLTPNQTLVMDTGAEAASITGLLRQGQKIGQIFDSPDVTQIVGVLQRHADLTEPVSKSIMDFAKILADSQTAPFSQTLAVTAGLVNGLNDFVPLVGLLNELLDGLRFLGEPGGAERTTQVLHQIGHLLGDVGALLATHLPWLVPLIASVVDLAAPAAYVFGSLAPSYDRLSGALDRTSAAFPFQDGRVRMQIEVILDAVPGLVTALPAQPGGGR